MGAITTETTIDQTPTIVIMDTITMIATKGTIFTIAIYKSSVGSHQLEVLTDRHKKNCKMFKQGLQ